MIKNYFIIAWRNLVRDKIYSLINVSGLAFGLAVAILIGSWVFDEISFNRSFSHYDKIVQVYHHITFGTEVMTIGDLPAPIGEELKNNYGEFESVAITTTPAKHIISHEELKLTETGMFVEPSFIPMFSIYLPGVSYPFPNNHSVVLTEKLAKKLFTDDPVGKTVKFNDRELLTVTAVCKDFPSNSTFSEVNLLLPISLYFSLNENQKKQYNWEDYSFECFALLKDHTSLENVNTKVKHVLFDNASQDARALKPIGFLFEMKKWHLYSEFKNGVNTGGPITFVILFALIGLFVLILACINFVNLTTARSSNRSREVGIRKVMGSLRSHLTFQFLSESFVIVVIAYGIGFLTALVLLPWFNELSGKAISIQWNDLTFITTSILFIIFTSLLAGIYPSLYLSSFNPVNALKGRIRSGSSHFLSRKLLVIFQFVVSLVLIITSSVVYQQIQHGKNRPRGFDLERIFHVAIHTDPLAKADYNSLRNEMTATGVVENMALSDFPITGSMSGDASLTWEGKDPTSTPLIAINSCSHDFPRTNGFQFLHGRDFSRERSTDSLAVIINEMAAQLIANGDALGKKIRFGYGKEREIIGVIKDQIRWTPFVKQSPHLYYINYQTGRYLTIRLTEHADVHEALSKVEHVIRKFDEGAPFDYKFQDEDYERLFDNEERIGKLATTFAALAIFISSIGIFGMAAFTSSQRTREIGIRKVLGATVLNVWRMLSGDFIKLIMISILIGIPLAYYIATHWLDQYDYRVQLSWEVFLLPGILIIAITLLTVSYQTIRAALANPTESLRAE